MISCVSGEISDKTLVAIYMVGSDLESIDDLATIDINEILLGVKELPESVEIIIGYGGSRKMGWEGLTIANYSQIKTDYSDGIIGNEYQFQFHDSRLNMGSSEGFLKFLQYLEKKEKFNQTILIFWDHGGGYDGVCFDENHDMDPLDLKELRETFQSSTIHWNLIGMDACLMGSYEVARCVEGFADYLLVSEEAEPGHGWNYTIPMKTLIENPSITVPDWGITWIDDYMDNPTHEKNKKTLSLIDLNQVQLIETGLTDLSSYLNSSLTKRVTYDGIGESFLQSQRYGFNLQDNIELSIDLSDLSSHMMENIPESSQYSRNLIQAIDDVVVYQRNDGSRPGSHGVSIFSPRMKQNLDFEAVSAQTPLNEEWKAFIGRYLSYISMDMSNPKIVPLGEGKYKITDDQGLAYVRIDTDWIPDITNWSHSYGLKSEPVYPSDPDIYVPNPDDQTFYLMDSVSGEKVPFFHSFIGNNNDENESYFGYIQVIRGNRVKEAAINIIREPLTGKNFYLLFPYEVQEDGKQTFSKVPIDIKPGDIIIPKIVERFLDSTNPRWQYSLYTPLKVTGTVEVVRDRLPYGSFNSVLSVSDYNMNYALQIVGTLRFPNNSSVSLKE